MDNKKCSNCEKSPEKLYDCSRCKLVKYCSQDCQKQHWKNHKLSCKQLQTTSESNASSANSNKDDQTVQITEDNAKSLLKLLKHHYLDISKIIGFFDQNKSQEFKKKNAYFKSQSSQPHKHEGDNDSGCCSAINKFYIPEKDMSTLEKQIYELVRSKFFLKVNLAAILVQINESYKNIIRRGQSQGLEFNSEVEKEILTKCMYETVNKFVYDHVKTSLVKEEQSYSKQPMLIAHPSHVKSMKDGKLDQLGQIFIQDFVEKGYAIKDRFCDDEKLIGRVYERLELMEIEGRFQINKSIIPYDQRLRADKIYSYNMNEIENIEEYKDLHKYTKLLYFLPFELNMKLSSLQLQLSEHFEISYFAMDHSWFKKHIDSGFEKERDTGLKVTILAIINNDKEVDSKYGKLSIYSEDGQELKQEMWLKNNTLIALKSRKFQYEISDCVSKVFVFSAKISGPQDPSKSC